MSHNRSTTETSAHSSAAVKADIDERLNIYFSGRFNKADVLDSSYGELWAVLRTVALAGGKRLRPYITVLAYECYGGNDYQSILQVALAEELLHLSLLIHDDIADSDYVRHGVLNVAGQYQRKYGVTGRSGKVSDHFANMAALMGGDLLLSAAHTQIFSSGFSSPDKAAVLELLGEVAFEVAAGQHLDMEAVLQAVPDSDPLHIARHKTAGYSFVGPLLCGAMLAHAPMSDRKILRRIGYDTGIAFQLMDDLLGTFGDEAQTGKSNSHDLREGKRTLLAKEAFSLASPRQQVSLRELFGKVSLTDEEVEQLREIMIASGAKAKVESMAQHYNLQALGGVKLLALGEPARNRIRDLIVQTTHRKY